MIARAQIQAWRDSLVGFIDSHRGCEAIAEAMDGLDDFLAIVPDRLAQPIERGRQDRVRQHSPRPARRRQLIFGDDLSGVLQQVQQHQQRLAMQPDFLSAQCEA